MSQLAIQGGKPSFDRDAFRWPLSGHSDESAVRDVVAEANWWSGVGARGAAFASEFAAYQECKHGLAVTNGTHTLQVALAALRLAPGAEVILPSYTFIATATAVLHSFAVPVFVDIDPATFNLDPVAVEAAVGPRTEAIIAVHMAGQPADMDELARIARNNGLALIEDAAQAHGAEWRGRKVGGLGDIGSFSFQGTKTLTAGEGGLVTTNDDALADRMYSVVNAGRRREGGFYDHFVLGSNFRMTELQAALLQSQFERFPGQFELRQRNAATLARLLEDVPGITPQRQDARATGHGFYSFAMLYDEREFGGLPRNLFMKALMAEGLPLIGVYPPLHETHLFKTARNECPALYRLSDNVPDYGRLSLPKTKYVTERIVNIKHQFLLAGEPEIHQFVELLERIREAALHDERAFTTPGLS